MSDAMDCPMWREKMGPCGEEVDRIGLLYFIDGIPPFNLMGGVHGSLMPGGFIILSLPPEIRHKHGNVLTHMLMPESLSAEQQRKFYTWSAKFEMDDLQTNGVSGVRAIIFGDTLDTPGRAKFLNMKGCKAYRPCPYCFHEFSPGLLSSSCTFDGYRRWLPPRHPLRCGYHAGYQYRCTESRGPPRKKLHQDVFEACHVRAENDMEHVFSHKGLLISL